MSILQSIFLGIVQGLTEFLPISSSGHLVLFRKIFQRFFDMSIAEGVVTFEIALHVATLVAVVIVFRSDIAEILRKPLGKLPVLIVVGTIPTLIIGLAFKDVFEKVFSSGITLGFEFIFTGLVLWYAESVSGKNKGLEETTKKDAVVIGVAQGIAILPAVSRSGLTLAGALFRGLNREFALKFSFLMSIPAILAAAAADVLDIIKAGSSFDLGIGVLPLIVGMIAAGISGYIAVKFMMKIFTKTSLKVFAYYVFALGLLIIADQFIFKIVF